MNSLDTSSDAGASPKLLLFVIGAVVGLELLVILSWQLPGATCAGTTVGFVASLYSVYAADRFMTWLARTLAAILAMKLISQGVPLLWAGVGMAALGFGGFYWNHNIRNTRDKTAYSRFAFARWLLLVGVLWAIAGCAVP